MIYIEWWLFKVKYFEVKDIVESCMFVNNNEINSGDRIMNYCNV